jgi:prepilin-type N-terminal cleavage/methylation domain-containing protein
MPQTRYGEKGISLVEVLVALIILSIGLLGLVGAGATVNRMIGAGRWNTVTMTYAQRRMDLLRAAARDSAACAMLTGGSAPLPGGLSERWRVSPGMRLVGIEVIVAGRGARVDTLSTVIPCL